MANSAMHIGTSGWHYQHWKGPFYPPDIAENAFLSFYAKYFDTVEVNNTFYRLPEESVFESWRDAVPDNFRFAMKASRYITHRKRLIDAGASVQLLMNRVKGFGNKLGPILFQLPPNWKLNLGRIEDFLSILPGDRRYAMEFRDSAWYTEAVYKALSRYNVSFCIHDFPGVQSPRVVTADFVYVRFHGPDSAYAGKYSPEKLREWAGVISEWAEQGKETYCYFNNDQSGYAVENALQLKVMLGKVTARL